MFGVTGPIRRAAASIPANIAEGCCGNRNAELGRFLSAAFGSAGDLEYHFILANDLNLISDSEFDHLFGEPIEVRKMPNILHSRLRTKKLITNNQ